ncbi:glycosyltransferase family 1 protein [Aerococcus viridans]|uniref:Glycosyltransferase family 1 protein n=1 Tax=Aerococcus viridans TaxID=1377 RepID=A0A2N6UFL0_9LACT|nr:glycosyltransferase family 4 protein [Aerococcus viridans]PMC80350.1 glycosyltransferase family 1 protein [Aerococcus viridans]
MKRALIITSVASMIYQFNKENIKILIELGYDVVVATNFLEPGNLSSEDVNNLIAWLEDNNVGIEQLDFQRSPFGKKNLTTYRKIKKLINKNQFNLIHCQSPIGGVLTRIAARKLRKNGTKIIYTAHGFHFFEGAPKKNWMIYFPIEKFLSRWTDILITINKEDFSRAKQYFIHPIVKYIPGVGLDTSKFKSEEINVNTSSKINLISIGELNENKNHEIVIRALKKINDPNIQYSIIGLGEKKYELLNLVTKLNLQNTVFLLGYKHNVRDYLIQSDAFVFPSLREGLGMAALEAMASGTPILTSKIHGINDYSEDGRTGFTFDPSDIDSVARAIINFTRLSNSEVEAMKRFNIRKAEEFDKSVVNKKMFEIYKLGENNGFTEKN